MSDFQRELLQDYERTHSKWDEFPRGATTMNTITERLEYLRQELRNERISYSELAELESLAEHIDPSDVELLEAAGVPEFQD